MPPLIHSSEQSSVNGRPAKPLSPSDDLGLPSVRKFTSSNPSSYYGSLAVAAAYCGLDFTPEDNRGFWQHGWVPDSWQHDPAMVTLGLGGEKADHQWVARLEEEEYLRSCGYSNVTAIGLPIVYLPHEETERRPGSLLVMPAHSLDYTTHDWKFHEYADAIVTIRDRFTEVVICVHPSCWKRGFWVDAFVQRGFKVVQGALLEDLNALKRIHRLLSGFEYVTTNQLGSHAVYAAYLGAKVSVFGPYAEFDAVDFSKDEFYVQRPRVLEQTLRAASEAEMQHHYPHLFCHPLETQQRVDWGRHEVGYHNKVSPGKMRSLFRWRIHDRAAAKFLAICDSQLWRVKHLEQLAFESEYRRNYIKTRWSNKRTHNL